MLHINCHSMALLCRVTHCRIAPFCRVTDVFILEFHESTLRDNCALALMELELEWITADPQLVVTLESLSTWDEFISHCVSHDMVSHKQASLVLRVMLILWQMTTKFGSLQSCDCLEVGDSCNRAEAGQWVWQCNSQHSMCNPILKLTIYDTSCWKLCYCVYKFANYEG